MIHLFTIGFTKKSARDFFSRLRSAGVRTVIDTRLNNTGQLSGYAKRDDLAYFLKDLLNVNYVHWQESAPTDELLKAYRDKKISWEEYEREYRSLIEERRIEQSEIARHLDYSCLLCSEAKPHRCHRRLLAEYLKSKAIDGISITHLE